MSNIIYTAVRDLVVRKFGDKIWKKICSDAGALASPPFFLKNNSLLYGVSESDPGSGFSDGSSPSYDDQVLTDIVKTSSKRLSMSCEAIVELSGMHFVEYIPSGELKRQLPFTGVSFLETVKNVNALHSLVKTSNFLKVPMFQCNPEAETRVRLSYSPGAEGRVSLGQFAIGLLKGLAEWFFRIHLTVEQTRARQPSAMRSSPEGWDEYLLTWRTDTPSPPKRRTSIPPLAQMSAISKTPPSEGTLSPRLTPHDGESLRLGLSGDHLGVIAPFHFVFDDQLEIIQVGPSLVKMISQCRPRTGLAKVFKWENRAINTFGDFENCMDTTITFSHSKYRTDYPTVTLSGELLPSLLNEKPLLLFIGSPVFSGVEEAKAWGMNINDFPLHDRTTEQVFASEQAVLSKSGRNRKAGLISLFRSRDSERDKRPVTPVRKPGSRIGMRDQALHRAAASAEENGRASYEMLRTPGSTPPLSANIPLLPLETSPSSSDVSDSSNPSPPQSGGHHMSPAMVASNSTPPSRSRLVAQFHEMLLQDAWQKFQLTKTLLDIAFRKQNDELFGAIARYFALNFRARELLDEILRAEINRNYDSDAGATQFRADSICTRIVIRNFEIQDGLPYLKSVLSSSLNLIYTYDDTNVEGSEMWERANSSKVVRIAQELLKSLCATPVPTPIASLLSWVAAEVGVRSPDSQLTVVSTLLFLRFIGAAIVTPEKYGLIHRPPTMHDRRMAGQVTRVMQSLISASCSGKEASDVLTPTYQPFVNRQENRAALIGFLSQFTTQGGYITQKEFPQNDETMRLLSADGTTIRNFMIAEMDVLWDLVLHSETARSLNTMFRQFLRICLSETHM